MYMQDQNLGFLKKAFKKVGRVVKKVTKPALHIGAAVYTGGASLQASAQMLSAKRAQKGQAQQSAAELNSMRPDFDDAAYLLQNPDVAAHKKWRNDPWGHYVKYGAKDGRLFPQRAMPGSASSAAWAPQTTAVRAPVPYTPIRPSVAQPAYQAQQFLQPPGNGSDAMMPSADGTPTPAQSALPSWAIPAVVGGGALLLVMMTQKGRR